MEGFLKRWRPVQSKWTFDSGREMRPTMRTYGAECGRLVCPLLMLWTTPPRARECHERRMLLRAMWCSQERLSRIKEYCRNGTGAARGISGYPALSRPTPFAIPGAVTNGCRGIAEARRRLV
jgi:hypothetical protein